MGECSLYGTIVAKEKEKEAALLNAADILFRIQVDNVLVVRQLRGAKAHNTERTGVVEKKTKSRQIFSVNDIFCSQILKCRIDPGKFFCRLKIFFFLSPSLLFLASGSRQGF